MTFTVLPASANVRPANRRPYPIALAVMALLCAGVEPAVAAKPGILVLGLQVEGLSARVSKRLDGALRKEVRAYAGRRMKLLPKPALDFAGMKLAAGCVEDGPQCLVVIGQTLGAAKVVQASLMGSPERAVLNILVVELVEGTLKAATVRSAELTEVSGRSAAELRVHVAIALGVKKTPPSGSLALYVASDIGKLAGATVLLDDRKVTRARLEHVAPGDHRIEVRQKGFETFIWLGAVRPSRQTRVPVSFVPSASAGRIRSLIPATPEVASPMSDPAAEMAIQAEPEPAGARPFVAEVARPASQSNSHVFTWLLSGAGVVAAAVGVVHGIQVLQVQEALKRRESELSERCIGPDCDACTIANPPANCEEGDHAATIANISFAVAGALAVGGIAAFFIEGGDAAPDGVEVLGAVAPAADGAAATLRVRF